jgi:signal transduction histidine kinase
MKDEDKTKEQLIDELQAARDHLAVLSAAEAERKRTQAALQESEQAYRSLFDHSPVSIWHEDGSEIAERMKELRGQGVQDLRAYFDDNPGELIQMAGRIKIIDVNDCSVAMFGAESKEHLADNLTRTFGDKALEVFREELISIWAGNRTFEAQLQSRTLDGRRIDLLFRMHVERGDEELDLSRVIITMMDITEHKRAEEETRKLERQLLEAQKLESLGVLAGGIAHDFNNLLTGILGGADLALSKMSPESPGRRHVAVIQKAAARATDLTNQMLAYSGHGRVLVEHLNLSALVVEMEQLLESSVSKKVLLESDLPADLPAVMADATQLRQVVMNLIINASEAMGEGKGIVSVRTELVPLQDPAPASEYPPDGLAPGNYVCLGVSDTGCGMDEETQARMFDPFSTTKFQGRGLGLAAVLGIVRGHKGAITVSSEPGDGTTVRVLLPAVDRSSPPEHITPVDGTPLLGSGTVLVVDDEDIVREVAHEMLNEQGFDVLLAADGRQGVELYRAHAGEIAVVLLDLTMPEMGGEQALDEIRRIQPNAKVILCSGYAEEDLKKRFAGTGATDFLHKPFRVGALVKKLRAVLET